MSALATGDMMAGASIAAHTMALILMIALGIGLGAALSMCVFPFILPDIAKMALAILISARLKPLLKRR